MKNVIQSEFSSAAEHNEFQSADAKPTLAAKIAWHRAKRAQKHAIANALKLGKTQEEADSEGQAAYDIVVAKYHATLGKTKRVAAITERSITKTKRADADDYSAVGTESKLRKPLLIVAMIGGIAVFVYAGNKIYQSLK